MDVNVILVSIRAFKIRGKALQVCGVFAGL